MNEYDQEIKETIKNILQCISREMSNLSSKIPDDCALRSTLHNRIVLNISSRLLSISSLVVDSDEREEHISKLCKIIQEMAYEISKIDSEFLKNK